MPRAQGCAGAAMYMEVLKEDKVVKFCAKLISEFTGIIINSLRSILMALWEQILLGAAGFLILFFFWPGVKVAMEKSKQAENPDWGGALLPIGIVVLFVILLIFMAKN